MFPFFLQRPVLSIVLSIIIVFTGLLSLFTLPVSQYPEIAPPLVMVSASYPGASAKVLTESVIIPLEQAINGVPGMRYMTADATSAGECNVQVVFDLDVDPQLAMVNVYTRISQVLNRLPPLVQREGVIVNYLVPGMLMYINLYSKDPKADMKFLFNYANIYVIPEIQRIRGVGQARILGSRYYAMRIWLKPDRMRAYKVSVQEVMEALSRQSIFGAMGRLGRADGKEAQQLEFVLTYKGRYNEPREYENVVIRSTSDGEILHLKDVADVEFGSEYYDIYSTLNEHPSAAILLKQNYGSNASEVIAAVKAKLEEIKKKSFPPGMDYEISYDVSRFLQASFSSVLHTLRDAFILVAGVVLLFLGNWRLTLVSVLAIPVALIGAFVFIGSFGATINLVTLFALVLAIGIVVDNAIVVVEAVHAQMELERLSPYEATQRMLQKVGSAVIAITFLMAAIFVPLSFMKGPVGVFYRQFSITMASSILLSGVVALTLTPVLCVFLLKPTSLHEKPKGFLGRFQAKFDQYQARLTEWYGRRLSWLVPRPFVTVAAIGGMGLIAVLILQTLPSGFIPSEDQGMLYAVVQTPPGSTLERTFAVSKEIAKIAQGIEGVQSTSTLAGYELLTEGRGSNAGTCLINLKPWSERHHTALEILYELEERCHREIPGAKIEFFEPPPVPGYGAAGGFALQLLDKTFTGDYEQLERVNNAFMRDLAQRKEISGLFTFYSANYPQYELIVDADIAMQKGVSLGEALDALGIFIGSSYELGFIRFQRFFKVFVQAHPHYRKSPEDLRELWVKNDKGEMVPLSSFISLRKIQGPNEINRYNMYPTASIRGMPARGYSSGEAIQAIREVAAQTLPRGFDIDWAGISRDEVNRGNEALYIFLVVLGFAYLVLAAQYESFILPLVVVFSLVPGILGAYLFVKFLGLANDIYTQMGVMMLIGLLGKNAVLIVQYAVQLEREGLLPVEAAILASKARLRPILMTSFAFIVGLIPLLLATGPGAIANHTIGGSAFGGMLLGVVLGVFVTPPLYYLISKLEKRFRKTPPQVYTLDDLQTVEANL